MGKRQELLGPDLMRANFAAYDAAVEKVLGPNASRKLSDTQRSTIASATIAAETRGSASNGTLADRETAVPDRARNA